MKTIERDHVVIHYTITGNGPVTLLFVHGSYIDSTYWKEQADYFKTDYTVVTMDLAGHGQSGKEREKWSVEGLALDVVSVIDGLDLKNVILIGHSLAGDINLMVATSFPGPLIGFIGIDTFKNAATPLSEEYRKKANDIMLQLETDFENTNEQYVKMALITPETPPEVTERIIKEYRRANKPLGTAIMDEVFHMDKTESILLPQLPFTLYLINVDYYPTNEESLKKYARNGYKLLHLQGTSHFPMIEKPYELNQLLQTCFDEIVAEA